MVEHSGFKLDLKSSEYDVYTYQFHQHSNEIQTSRSEDIEIETFFRLGKIDSVVSENEIIVIPLDLPKCSINTDNVELREKGVVNCTVYPQKTK